MSSTLNLTDLETELELHTCTFRDELAMLESRDQGKPFINAKMIDVPGSAQARFQDDFFIQASYWF